MPPLTLRNVRRYAKNLALFRSSYWAKGVHDYPIRFSRQNVRDLSQGIYMPEADAYIPRPEAVALALFADSSSIRALREHEKATFSYDDRRWLVELEGVKFWARTKLDFWVIWEIFTLEAYSFWLPKKPALILDIGLNIGLASHYFALHHDCPIHAFEIFPPTFELAEQNFALNPTLAAKVTRHCVGLGAKEEELTLPYNEEDTGAVGLYYVSSSDRDRQVKVKVAQASETLGALIREAGEGPVVAKIDCEGSEFPILRDLAATGVLQSIDLILMEWHGIAGDPGELVRLLAENGFGISSQRDENNLGIIRAMRIAAAH